MSPFWISCPGGCGDYWCTRHQEHVHDCACPPIEEWLVDPYLPLTPERARRAGSLAALRGIARMHGWQG